MVNPFKKKEEESHAKKSSFNFLKKSDDEEGCEVGYNFPFAKKDDKASDSPKSTSTKSTAASPSSASQSSKSVTAAAGGSSRFSFKNPLGKKNASSASSNAGVVETAVPPSPDRSASSTNSHAAASPDRSKSVKSKSKSGKLGVGLAGLGLGAKLGSSRNKGSSSKSMSKKQQGSSSSSSSKSKKASQQRNLEQEFEQDQQPPAKSKSSSSSSSSSCCSCKSLICTSCILIIGIIIGVCTWRYGPWSADSAQVTSFTTTATCDTCCNGLPSNCDKQLNDVIFPMVHNAHSSAANKFTFAYHTKSMEEALVAGYRAVSLATCNCEFGLVTQQFLSQDEEWGLGESPLGFCNDKCVKGVRDPKDVLSNLKKFLEINPREVLIIEFNMGEGTSSDLRQALQYSGLLEYVYHPDEQYYIEEWPTLQTLIDTNKRIVLFGIGDDMESCPASDCLDGILYTNDHVAQTEIDGSDITQCDPTISGDVLVSYFKMNHFEESRYTPPSAKDARELNSYSTLENRLATCSGKRRPNLLAVQFWDEGNVLEYVESVNKGNREFLEVVEEEAVVEIEDGDDVDVVVENTYEGPPGEGETRGRRLRGQ